MTATARKIEPNLKQCEICFDLFADSELVKINDENKLCCSDCFSVCVKKCACCDLPWDEDDLHFENVISFGDEFYGDRVCPECES